MVKKIKEKIAKILNNLRQMKIEEKFNNLLLKINEKFSKAYNLFFESKFGKVLFYILGVALIFTYLILFFFKEPIVDEEVQEFSMNNLLPWEIEEGENVLKEIFLRPFNLNITELGQYRPRYLAFFVQCVEENIFIRLVRAFPSFGNRNPFYPVAMILTIISFTYLIKAVWKKCPRSFAFFISCCIPLYESYQVTTYLRARSAKLFTVSACAFLLGYFLKNVHCKFEKKKIYKLLLAIPFFVLTTLDEQVLALVAILACVGILFSIIDKKVNFPMLIYSISSAIYVTYYFGWGKWLFKHFTGSLTKHGHSIEEAVETIDFKYISQALEILFKYVEGKIIFLSGIIFIAFWIFFFIKLKKEKTTECVKEHLMALILVAIPIAILTLLICSNKAIYITECLRTSVYTVVSGILLFVALIYVVGKSKTKLENVKPFVILIGVIVSLGYNLTHINDYYLNYLKESGGFFEYTSDIEITEDEIILDYVPETTMQYSNDSVLSSINTLFTTSDFKTAKVVSGKLSQIEDKYYITDTFSCYLITQKNRKLIFKANIQNYELYTSFSIYVNKLEIASFNIEDENIDVELDVRTERYRAGKVTLVFHKKQVDYEDEKNINLIELYMN